MCSPEFLTLIGKLDWIDLVPHGWAHPHPYECVDWSYGRMTGYLKIIKQDYPQFTRGFKASGWQISDGCYQALTDWGWWVADQIYNRERRPKGLRVYELDSPMKMHYHIGSWNSTTMPNSLDRPEVLETLLNLRGEFAFVKDVV